MAENSYRIQVNQHYAEALGRAIYSFCYLEWGIIWIIECLDQGFVTKASGKTARNIAEYFIATIKRSQGLDSALALRLSALANRFNTLVESRNALVHGNPYTAEGGEQRLSYSGKIGQIDWALPKIVASIREFEVAEAEANELLHAYLFTELKEVRRATLLPIALPNFYLGIEQQNICFGSDDDKRSWYWRFWAFYSPTTLRNCISRQCGGRPRHP